MGYIEGGAHSKQWLVSDEDEKAMYHKFSNGGHIILWCENIESESDHHPLRRKRRIKRQPEGRMKMKRWMAYIWN